MSAKRRMQGVGIGIIVLICLAIIVPAHSAQAQQNGWQRTLQDGQADQLISHSDGSVTAANCGEDDTDLDAQTFDADGNAVGEISNTAPDEERLYVCNDTKAVDKDGVVYGVRDREIFGRAHPTFAVEAYQNSERLWRHTFQYDRICHISDPEANWLDVGPNGQIYVFFTRGFDRCDEAAPDHWLAALDPADGHTVWVKKIDEFGKYGDYQFGVYQDGLVGKRNVGDGAVLQFYHLDGSPKGDPVETPIIGASYGTRSTEEFGVNQDGVAHMLFDVHYPREDLCGFAYNYTVTAIASEQASTLTDWRDCSVWPAAGRLSAGPWGAAVTRKVLNHENVAHIRTHDREGRELVTTQLPLPEDAAPLPETYADRTQLFGDVNGNVVYMTEYGRERSDGAVVPEAKIFIMNPYTGAVLDAFDTADLDQDAAIGFKIHNIALSNGRVYMLGDQCLAHAEESNQCAQTLETQLHALPMELVGLDYPRGNILNESTF